MKSRSMDSQTTKIYFCHKGLQRFRQQKESYGHFLLLNFNQMAYLDTKKIRLCKEENSCFPPPWLPQPL